MPLNIVNGDITLTGAEAVVSAADSSLEPKGGVSADIHRAAGPQLLEACRAIGFCEPGKAVLTDGYGLCRYVIHTVGPVWKGGRYAEEETLVSCYRSCLELAVQYGVSSVAFPLISAGTFRVPREKAMRIAVDTISSFLMSHEEDLDVTLALFKKPRDRRNRRRRTELDEYLFRNTAVQHMPYDLPHGLAAAKQEKKEEDFEAGYSREEAPEPAYYASYHAISFDAVGAVHEDHEDNAAAAPEMFGMAHAAPADIPLSERLRYKDESFSQMVLRLADEKHMTDPEVYKRSNLDRKLFSKIRNNTYTPSRRTALALAVGLRLTVDEARELLLKAGLGLSNSNDMDIIVQYYLEKGIYDIFEINNTLFEYDLPLLGSVSA